MRCFFILNLPSLDDWRGRTSSIIMGTPPREVPEDFEGLKPSCKVYTLILLEFGSNLGESRYFWTRSMVPLRSFELCLCLLFGVVYVLQLWGVGGKAIGFVSQRTLSSKIRNSPASPSRITQPNEFSFVRPQPSYSFIHEGRKIPSGG